MMKKYCNICCNCFCKLLVLLFICSVFNVHMVQTAYSKSSDNVLQKAMERGTLRVGISSFVPWAMQDKSGNYIGFEVDVAKRLAEDFGLELELRPTRWSGIIPALLTGKFDLIISGVSITPQRSLKVNFSIPYDYVGIEVVGLTSALQDRKDWAEFNNQDCIVAVRNGSTAAITAKKTLPKATIRLFEDEPIAIQEMLSGRAVMFFTSAPLGSYEVIKNNGKVQRVSEELLDKQPIAIAMRKGDHDSLNAINAWITLVNAEGWLKERKAYWFEGKEWENLLH